MGYMRKVVSEKKREKSTNLSHLMLSINNKRLLFMLNFIFTAINNVYVTVLDGSGTISGRCNIICQRFQYLTYRLLFLIQMFIYF